MDFYSGKEVFFDKENRWYRAVFNIIPLKWSGCNLSSEVIIKDETLREGEEVILWFQD